MTIVIFGYNAANTCENIRFAPDKTEADKIALALMSGVNPCNKVELFAVKSDSIEADSEKAFEALPGEDNCFPEYRDIVKKMVGRKKALRVYWA